MSARKRPSAAQAAQAARSEAKPSGARRHPGDDRTQLEKRKRPSAAQAAQAARSEAKPSGARRHPGDDRTQLEKRKRPSAAQAAQAARSEAKPSGARKERALRTETANGVRHIVLARPDEYNTITPLLRDELARAIDAADADRDVRVILLRAEGPAFCAGYGLDWSTRAQAREARAPSAEELGPAPWRPGSAARRARERSWDSVADLRMMGEYVAAYMKLWYAKKPTIAAVQGWCIGGGTDLALCADLVVAADDARFGYPPSRVWGTPTTAMWVYRMGLERAKRYVLTGDEIPARTAAQIGMILETVPARRLAAHATALAERMAMVPASQLVMLKLLCNQTAEQMGLASSRLLGTLFDGIARHTQEGLDFVARAQAVGFREAVRERDDPFGDYGSRRAARAAAAPARRVRKRRARNN